MKHQMQALIVALLLGFTASIGWAFFGDGPLISATLVTDKKQTGEKEDKTIQISGVSSEGYIEGSTDGGKKRFIFGELKKIVFDLGRHAYDVTDRQGNTWTLKFGQIKTHNTSPTFDCMIKNPESGKVEELRLDFTQIKSLEFGEPPAAPASATEGASDPAKP